LKFLQKIKRLLIFDTYGAIATASFLICLISGIVLTVPYDVTSPYESLSLTLIANPGAVFFRNLHYWSAQLFLVFVFLHIWDHFKTGSEKNISKGVWLRLSVSILFVFFVMISGFVLKGDADSEQARRIITNLVERIPLLGGIISTGLFGNENNYQLIYIHHIATATIFLVVIIFEHARTLWTKYSTFLIALFVITILSFIFNAPLHNNVNPVVKGPWYFTGLQEILHWFSNPVFIIWFVLILIITVYLLKFLKDKPSQIVKKTLFYLFWIYFILTIIGFFFRGENWKWQTPWQESLIVESGIFNMGIGFFNEEAFHVSENNIPVINGRREACLVCHNEIEGFSPSHDTQAIGCTSCHFGDPFTLNKNRAHKNMLLIPGNLTDARYTCGTTDCHPEIVSRVNRSLMTTNSGIVSVDKFVFGESNNLDSLFHIENIGHTIAESHLRDLCANCHLGNKKTETGPITQLSRGGGCNACHLNYDKHSLEGHIKYLSKSKTDTLIPVHHPSLDLNISNEHCYGCHSRSGRISTNYMGWHETLLDENEVVDSKGYKVMEDKRVYKFVAEDIHHQKGLVCVDCHTSFEVMGDENTYLHEDNAVKIQCKDCHFDKPENTVLYSDLDTESKKIFDLNRFQYSDKPILKTINSDFPIVNTFIDEDGFAFLIGKESKEVYPLISPGQTCTKGSTHSNISCSACHSAWAPQCIGCHNDFDKNTEGFDLLENKFKKGQWVEYAGEFIAGLPTLGVRELENGENNDKKIECAIPGMILTVDKNSYLSDDFKSFDESVIFHRLFAPSSPHTIVKEGRSCKSCHNNPLAIGYGRGELNYIIENNKGYWEFKPEYAPNKNDGLPEDAWIEFNLNTTDQNGGNSTRTDFRSFNIEEQKRILRVGACLTCHDENSEIMQKSLEFGFEEYIKTVSNECILP